MERIRRNILLIAIIILSVFLSMVSFVAAEPVVENITTNPTSPTPLSTITVTANITGEDITNVNLSVGECNRVEGVCYIYHEVSMTEITEGQYKSAEVTLEKSKTTYISYTFDITYDGVTEKFVDDSWDVDLSIDSGNGGTTNGGDGTPGFEIITLLAAIIIGILLIKRKRF